MSTLPWRCCAALIHIHLTFNFNLSWNRYKKLQEFPLCQMSTKDPAFPDSRSLVLVLPGKRALEGFFCNLAAAEPTFTCPMLHWIWLCFQKYLNVLFNPAGVDGVLAFKGASDKNEMTFDVAFQVTSGFVVGFANAASNTVLLANATSNSSLTISPGVQQCLIFYIPQGSERICFGFGPTGCSPQNPQGQKFAVKRAQMRREKVQSLSQNDKPAPPITTSFKIIAHHSAGSPLGHVSMYIFCHFQSKDAQNSFWDPSLIVQNEL